MKSSGTFHFGMCENKNLSTSVLNMHPAPVYHTDLSLETLCSLMEVPKELSVGDVLGPES